MGMIEEKLFHLLRYSLGAQSDAPTVAGNEWADLHAMAAKQALLGVTFTGIERMKAEEATFTCPRPLMLQWFTECDNIEKRNIFINEALPTVVQAFAKRGYRTCLLKGQGNALMYPNPLRRNPGDIDLWVEGSDHDIITMVRGVDPTAETRYLHIDLPAYKGIEVEVHYRPSFMQNFRNNRRLQQFFTEAASAQFDNVVSDGYLKGTAVPDKAFDLIFQMSHINRHVLKEGIGLRQLTDYYLLLKAADGRENGIVARVLQNTGLLSMARAVMYVMREVFTLDERMMIVEPDERRGRIIMTEIIAGGNFGQGDERYHFAHNAIGRNILGLWRDLRLMRYFPAEALSEPLFRLYHFFWRLAH